MSNFFSHCARAPSGAPNYWQVPIRPVIGCVLLKVALLYAYLCTIGALRYFPDCLCSVVVHWVGRLALVCVLALSLAPAAEQIQLRTSGLLLSQSRSKKSAHIVMISTAPKRLFPIEETLWRDAPKGEEKSCSVMVSK